MIERVIFAGGGTGGHLFPGLSVLEELRRREPELEALFVGTARGIETRVVPELGERLECIDVGPLKGRSPRDLAKNLLALPRAGLQATAIVRRFRPDLVIGVGGYAAGPLVAAAKALSVPTALLEQNAHVGLTNRLLARLVDRAYLSFEHTAASFPPSVARFVGNPVRRRLVDVGRMARMDPAGFEMRARKVLVIGGSQGARVLNEAVPQALALAGLAQAGVQVVHQTGHAMCDEVRARYEALGIDADVTPFIADMAGAYASAAFVIARAGATSLAEICAVGRPSILIPFPYAADDHQWHNARALEVQGAAIAIREAELTAEGLAQHVSRLVQDRALRLTMTDAARGLGRPEAAAAIVDDLCALLGCATGDDADVHEADLDDARSQGNGGPEEPSRRTVLVHPASVARRRRERRRSAAWACSDPYYGARMALAGR